MSTEVAPPVAVVCIILVALGYLRLGLGSQKTSVLLGCVLVIFGCIRLLLVVFWLSYDIRVENIAAYVAASAPKGPPRCSSNAQESSLSLLS